MQFTYKLCYKRYGEGVIVDKKNLSYESVLAVQPDWVLEEQKSFFSKLREVIKQFKGSLHHIDSWGIRRFANRNKKNWKQGLYFHFSFQGQAGVVTELSRHIRMNDHVVYHHFEKLPAKQSLADKLKSFREIIEDSINMEKERQERIQKRKATMARPRPPGEL